METMPCTTHMPGRFYNHPRMPSLFRKLDIRSRRATVEAFPHQWCGRAFYIPDTLPTEHEPFIPVQFVAFKPGPSADSQLNKDLVYVDSHFEIKVKGMSVSRFDPIIPFRSNKNEIVLYSTQKDPEGNEANEGAGGITSKIEGVPYIHYDHKKDRSVTPDKYYPIPDSKSLVVRSGRDNHREKVNVRFNIIEVDEKNADLDKTLSNLDQLGGTLSEFTAAVPYLALLNPALSLVGALGSRTLENLARPDKVLNCDVDFKVAKKEGSYLKRARPGNYLRYGYYAFLAEPVCCKLYLSTNTLQNMRLMVRKIPSPKSGKHKTVNSEPEYVPLKHCDYIIIRVVEPESDATDRRASIRASHVRRLQNILSTASSAEPQDLKRSITSVLKDVGLQTADVTEQIWEVPHKRHSKAESQVKDSHGDSTDEDVSDNKAQ